MLKNLQHMLEKQGHEGIVLFGDDEVGVENINDWEFLNRYTPRFQEPQCGKDWKMRFYPPFCIKKKCIVGVADHEQKGRLVVVFCGMGGEEKVNKKALEILVGSLKKPTNLIVITAGVVTPQAKEFLKCDSSAAIGDF